MPLKIKVDPREGANFALGCDVKFIDMESGIDISESIRSATIDIDNNEFVTTNIVCEVGELVLNGIDIFKFEKKGNEEIDNISKDELNNLITKSHPYIENIVKCYGEQGCNIEICNSCRMLKCISFPKGKTIVGPTIYSSMYCQHR